LWATKAEGAKKRLVQSKSNRNGRVIYATRTAHDALIKAACRRLK
jgi:hypothetical protein